MRVLGSQELSWRREASTLGFRLKEGPGSRCAGQRNETSGLEPVATPHRGLAFFWPCYEDLANLKPHKEELLGGTEEQARMGSSCRAENGATSADRTFEPIRAWGTTVHVLG